MPTISVISVLYLMTYTCYATQSMAIPYACARDPRGPSRGSRPSQRRTGDGRRSGSNSSWLRPQLGRLSYEPNRRVSALMVIGLAVVSLWLTGCDPVMMSADPPSIVGEWAVYQYRVSITGSSPVDLADGRQITARFNESPQSYFLPMILVHRGSDSRRNSQHETATTFRTKTGERLPFRDTHSLENARRILPITIP